MVIIILRGDDWREFEDMIKHEDDNIISEYCLILCNGRSKRK